MIGRAISSKTSGGTGAGPGVNKYFFVCGTFTYSNIGLVPGTRAIRGGSQKKGWYPRLRIGSPRFAPALPVCILISWNNGADGQSQGDPVEHGSRRFRVRVVMALRQLLKVITFRCRSNAKSAMVPWSGSKIRSPA